MPTDLDNDLLILLSDVARHMRTYGDQLAEAHGITRAQLIILARLEGKPDLSQNELAAIAERAPMTIARLIDRLEALDLVERCTDPADRRIWRLRLTPAAAPFLRELKHFRTKLHSVATKGIEPAVLKAMALGLRQMKENVSSSRSTEVAHRDSRNVHHRTNRSSSRPTRYPRGHSTPKHQVRRQHDG